MIATGVDVPAIITRAIEAHFDMPDGWVLSPRRDRRVSWPRQIGMYLLRSRAGWSYENAARAFGRIDHTTALHADVMVMPRCRLVPDFRNALIEIDEAIDWRTIMPDGNKGRKNSYTCQTCGAKVITVDAENGVTPFMIGCTADGCDGVMESAFYSVDQSLMPTLEWYRPVGVETVGLSLAVLDHIKKGGLISRPIDYAKQAEITREQITMFRAVILQLRAGQPSDSPFSAVILQAQLDGMESQLETLEAEMAEYEKTS